VGLLDYYRQFKGLSEEEVNERLREEAQERRSRALERLEPLDLSQTTWPELPPSQVVNAVTYVARRGLHRYLDPHASELRGVLAATLDVRADQVVVGNGAGQLLGAAAQALLEPGDELITPWPSYPLYPLMARRARAGAVPVPGWGTDAILRAVNERTRLVALCNPNDPTGAHLSSDELDALLTALPERVVVLLDEALADYADAPPHASLDLLERHPRLLVFRTLSKAWGLAGLRCGFAVGSADAGPMLELLEPELGVGELVQAGALEALRVVPRVVERRTAAVREERARLTTELRMLGLDVPDSQANVLWIAREGVDGAQLAAGMGRAGVMVAPGGLFGDGDRVRVAVQTRAAGDRLLHAARAALGEPAA
jgi:histidinol-phosphate aminotransferase